ncbi:NADPH dehydrogenase [Saccharomycopsis crataegensis]|uniref:NADPH dehydrogenase n=1 Tax=Saccharomycopsis crataegensis TaxID=43959 RepID=A0AAV5QGE1_9ASCO|nr:NADPH dehydrogenase [Saccharomycopsis crataegensis]
MPSELANTNLFQPITIGKSINLSHRIVIPPLTRSRATPDHVPTDLMLQHYDDLTKTPGSLVISEATFVSLKAAGWACVPGVWSEQQAKAWRKITDKVHANGSYMCCQMWNLGRTATIEELVREGTPYKSASNIYISKEDEQKAIKLGNPLTPLTRQEIKEYIQLYADIAARAVNEAGFDIVEIHSAHGYLFDQFFQSISNNRTDEYGGSIENRARFFFEVVDSIIARVGGDRVACRISPWATHGGMAGANGDPHPIATFSYIFSELEKRRKQHGFAYVSIVEPRTNGSVTLREEDIVGDNEWVYEIYKGDIIRAGDYFDKRNPSDFSNIIKDVDANDRTLICLGRPSTSNPDIVEKLRNGWELNPYERKYFYNHDNYGYNTFARHGQDLKPTKEDKMIFGKPLA